MTSTEVFLLDAGLGNDDAAWPAAGLGDPRGTLDLGVVAGSLGGVRGDAIAVSRVVARDGDLDVGDLVHARMADTAPRTLRVAAIYDRAAGLGDVVLDPAVVRRHGAAASPDAVFVDGRAPRGALTRSAYLRTVEAADEAESWAVWLIIGLSAAFAALALVNTAAMATAERRDELATLRLLGGTRGHALRMIGLELAPTVLVALAAGAGVVAVAVMGVPRGVDGIDLVVPAALLAAMAGGAAVLGLAAGAVSARLALRASPAEATHARE
jgi:putative ABC transport system permease protein